MNTGLERKMDDLQRKLKGRLRHDGKPKPGYEQNVARIRAEMEIISGRIEIARRMTEGNTDGE